MTETNKLKEKVNTVSTTSPTVEVSTNQQQQIVDKKLITLTGITTSQINQALKADNPYPARVFLKVDKLEKKLVGHYDPTKRQCYICLAEKTNQEKVWCSPCKERVLLKDKDIPIFFRIKDGNNWIRPKIKKGSYLQVEGYFSLGTVYTKQSERKSFTALSYQVLDQVSQKVQTTYNHWAKQRLSHGKSLSK